MEFSPEFWEIIMLTLEVLISVLLPVVLGVAVVEGRKISLAVQERIRGEIGEQQYAMMSAVVADAVAAAEQYGLSEKIKNLGESKKEFAMAYAQRELNEAGINIDLNRLDASIEAAVNQTFNQV
jgi:hypothetical protein